MAKILVSLNPREGLADAMTLKYRDFKFLQNMDYENLPFCCHRCHKYGHLGRECILGHRRRRRQNKNFKTKVESPLEEEGKGKMANLNNVDLGVDLEKVESMELD